MAWRQDQGEKHSLKAVAAQVPFNIVKLSPTVVDSVVAIATVNDEPLGLVEASAAAGAHLAVFGEGNVVRAIAGASLGPNTDVGLATVGVASAAQDNSTANVVQLGPITAASGSIKWVVGKSLSGAAAGEVFSLQIRPRQIGGNA